MKRKLSTIIVTTVIVILILVFAGLIVQTVLQRSRPPQAAAAARPAAVAFQQPGGGKGARNATTVRVTPVVRSTIENSIMINGDVMAVNHVSIFPTIAGRVTATSFQIGDRITRGETVAMVDPSRPGQVYSESPVISTISGTILSTPVHVGDTVTTQTAIIVLGDLSSLMIETFVPERFANAAQRGLSAQVFLEAFPGEVFQAVVDEVSPVLDASSRTLRIRLRFAGAMDSRIKAGMFASVSLVTNTRRNVPVIPRGAVINTYGSWIVFIVDEQNIASRREVFLGLENENFVEILGGIEVGDLVVSAGQNFLSDGDLVRIVE